MSLVMAELYLEQAIDGHDPDEVRRAALALLMAVRTKWRCPSCGANRTGDICKACRVPRPKSAGLSRRRERRSGASCASRLDHIAPGSAVERDVPIGERQ